MKTLIALLLFGLLFGLSFKTLAKNQEINGFHFANCSNTKCVEVWAAKGYLSQLAFAFATEGETKIKITDLTTKKEQVYFGTNSSLNQRLNTITLEQSGNRAVMISLDNFKTELFPGSTVASTQKKVEP